MISNKIEGTEVDSISCLKFNFSYNMKLDSENSFGINVFRASTYEDSSQYFYNFGASYARDFRLKKGSIILGTYLGVNSEINTETERTQIGVDMNFGAVYFNPNKYYHLGISINGISNPNYWKKKYENNIALQGYYKQGYYVSTDFVGISKFHINLENKNIFGSIEQQFIWDDKLGFGVFYRSNEIIGLNLEIFNDWLFDFSVTYNYEFDFETNPKTAFRGNHVLSFWLPF